MEQWKFVNFIYQNCFILDFAYIIYLYICISNIPRAHRVISQFTVPRLPLAFASLSENKLILSNRCRCWWIWAFAFVLTFQFCGNEKICRIFSALICMCCFCFAFFAVVLNCDQLFNVVRLAFSFACIFLWNNILLGPNASFGSYEIN